MDRRLVWIVGIITSGTVLVAGFLGWQRAFQYERLFHLVRLDPLGLNTVRSTPTMPATIVFVGDSRAAAWPAPTGFTIDNRGVPGHTTIQTRLSYPLLVSPLKPQWVIIQVGVNDLTALEVFPHDAEMIIQNTITNLRAIIDLARTDGSRVILTTIFPLGPNPFERINPGTGLIVTGIERVNSAIRAMAAPDVLIFDSSAVLAANDGFVAEGYRLDLLHINQAGYRALNEALGPLLTTHIGP